MDRPHVAPRADRRLQRLLLPLLILCGGALWLQVDGRLVRSATELAALAAAVAVGLLPPVAGVAAAVRRRLNRLGPRATLLLATTFGAGAAAYLFSTAVGQGRPLLPLYQDEFSYLLQARMLTEGRLWLPAHPLAESFDTFYVLTTPVYASMYFPGTAMLLAPGVALGLPSWAMPLLISGAAITLAMLVARDLFGMAAACFVPLALAALPVTRIASLMSLAQAPALLLAMLMLMAWLRWRRRGGRGWLLLLGVASGWLAITRPLDALVFALPIGVDLLLRAAPRRAVARTLLPVVAAAAPFLGLQLLLNQGVTGSPWTTPFSLYAQRDYPNTTLGYHRFDPAARPVSTVPQKRLHYERNVLPLIREHRPENFPAQLLRRARTLVTETLPDPLLAIALPPALLALRFRRLRVVAACAALLPAAYTFYTFFQFHYVLPAAPLTGLLALAGFAALARRARRGRGRLRAAAALAGATLCALNLPELKRHGDDMLFFSGGSIVAAERALALIPDERAIVLVRFDPGQSLEEELVYNIDAARPDDARVLRAHDLPEHNPRLFAYYAAIDPRRPVYRYDRADASLRRLGAVGDLAAAYNPRRQGEAP